MVFKPGQSGNPTGRMKDVYEFARLCREKTPQCLEALVKILSTAPTRYKIKAIEILLARGYGQPIQGVEISGALEHNINPIINVTIGDTTTRIEAPPTREARALLDEPSD